MAAFRNPLRWLSRRRRRREPTGGAAWVRDLSRAQRRRLARNLRAVLDSKSAFDRSLT